MKLGEQHLRAEIKKRNQKRKVNNRHMNSNSACMLEKKAVQYEMNKKLNEKKIGEQETNKRREQEKNRRANERKKK